MTNNYKSITDWYDRLWLMVLLWLPLQVLAAAPKLSVDPFTIVAGASKSVPVMLDNSGYDITLLQFDMQLPEGLTLKPLTTGDYDLNMAGRTMWRTHSLQANRLTDGSYRVLLSSSNNTVIEGTEGTVIMLTLQAADDFKGGQMVLSSILMVGPDGQTSTQNRCECTVKSMAKPEAGSAKLSCQPLVIGIGGEAELSVAMNNANEEITLVQFDLEMPQGLTIKSVDEKLEVKMAGRTTAQNHSLIAVQLADGRFRVLLSSDKNATIQGSSGTIVTMILKAAEDFAGGRLIFSNILLVDPNEKTSTQTSYQQMVTAIVPDPVLATSINLGLSKSKLNKGETLQATYTLLPSDVTNRVVLWKSSNESVATINYDGLIEAVGLGTTTISVETTDGTKLSDSKLLTVEVLASKITLNLSKTTLDAGETLQATYTILPANVSNSDVTWESSNHDVATVNSSGMISAVGLGTAVITVKTADGSNISDSKQITVNEKVLERTLNGIKYNLYTWQKKAAVTSVVSQQSDIVIPENVVVDNVNYQVAYIVDSAFSPAGENGEYSLSITIPSSVTSIDEKAFDGVRTMSIIHQGNAKLTSHHISELRGFTPNALLYVKSTQVLPTDGLDNVVVDGTAQNVVLNENNEFHCPQQFVAKQISYTHHFMMETGIGEAAGWETIVLPYDVETFTHETKGNLLPFSAYTTGLENYMPFWLYELSANGFVKASSIQANKPYLISMPNNSKYTASFNLNGKVTFTARNAIVKTTYDSDLSQQTKVHDGKAFVPAYRFVEKEEGDYALNAITESYAITGGKTPGSVFIKGLRRICPFEGLFKYENANARSIIDIPFANESTDIMTTCRGPEKIRIYSLSGQFVGTFSSDTLLGKNQMLPAGIYIVNGKKFIVK